MLPTRKQQYLEYFLGRVSGNEPHINCKLCRECGGFCCDETGCGLMTCDIKDRSINGIRRMLDTGKYSIAFTYTHDESGVTPLPVMASREIGSGKVNYSLLHHRCSQKTKNGCSFSPEERPTQALLYIPQPNRMCYTLITPMEVIADWAPLQHILEHIIRVETGKTSMELFMQACKEASDRIMKKIREANYDLNNVKLSNAECQAVDIILRSNYCPSDFEEFLNKQ